jgi:hypothetical protein
MTDDRNRLAGMLKFAAEILAARESVRLEMGSGGGVVLREEVMAQLPAFLLPATMPGCGLCGCAKQSRPKCPNNSTAG